MKFSELWLREWINPAISSEILSDQITMAGLEVETVDPVSEDFHGVIVGEVVKCSQHPNANKLRMTKVNIGGDILLDIICGAPNCRSGLKVAVATIDSMLPGDLKIKATKIRGELSEGMLCSFSELGVFNDNNGIIEIPEDAPLGTNIRDYLQLNDNIMEIHVTPNRADCFSIMGIARDLSVLNKMPLSKIDMGQVVTTIDTTLPIHVNVPQACPRYLGRILKGINIKVKTPLWMSEKLRRCGMPSINIVCDITNYVLLELGQPVHAFDLNKIEGSIIVRMAKENEILSVLDGKTIKLNVDTLVIADNNKVLAIAGVLVGQSFGINYETQNVLLQSAFFTPLSIAGRVRQYNLHSDAAHRYERGVDPALQHQAIERTTHLIINICGGYAGPIIDVINEHALPKCTTIQLHRKKLDRLLGYIVSSKQVSDILYRLGCQVTEQGDIWLVVAPSWRFDIKIEEDLIEEIVRIYGYHNVPTIPIRANLVMLKHPESHLTLKRAKTLLVDHGFQEVITYSFVDPKLQSLLHPGAQTLILSNPISIEMSVMRLSLWTGLLSSVIYNQNRQQTHLRLFESGLCFVPDSTRSLHIRQDVMLGGVITGHIYKEHWDLAHKKNDFYDLKGKLESILELTGKLSDIQFQPKFHAALHPGQSAAIYLHDECIGYIGMIHPDLEHKIKLNNHALIFELQWDKIATCNVPRAQKISRFPVNYRDIAIVVPENVAAKNVVDECKKVDVNHIVSVKLFDIYRGNGVPNGYKSLAISLMLQDVTRTLKDKEIVAIVSKCIAVLTQRFQASLRD